VQDREGAKRLLEPLCEHERLANVLADGAYAGELQTWFHHKTLGRKRIQIIKRSDQPGFHVQPKRWIVERFFGWINWLRRLSKDYEHNPLSARCRLFIADVFLLTKQLVQLEV
jgi:transposase